MEGLFAYTFHRSYPSPINGLTVSSTLTCMANAAPFPPAAVTAHVHGMIHILVKAINTKAVVVKTPDGRRKMEPQFNEEVIFPCRSNMFSKPHPGEIESFISGTVVAKLHNICANARKLLMKVMPVVLAESIARAQRKGRFYWVELTAHMMTADLPAMDEGMAVFSTSKQLVDAAVFVGMMQVEPCGVAGEICPICFDDFLEGVGVVRIYCSHVFHIKCIGRWLHQKYINRGVQHARHAGRPLVLEEGFGPMSYVRISVGQKSCDRNSVRSPLVKVMSILTKSF